MSDQERTRWLDRESPADAALGDLLDAGKAELPSAAQLRSLAERLGPPFDGPGPGGGGGGGGGATGAATPAASIVPLASAAAAVLLLCGFWWLHTGSADDVRTRARDVRTRASETPAATDARRPAPAATAATAAPSSPAQLNAPVEPSRVGAAARARERPGARKPAAAPMPASRDSLAELELLEQAHRALVTDPARALVATETHAQRFPASQFAQERELIAIEALRQLGRSDEARVRGERFLALHPHSSHARKVRALIAAASTPAADAAPVRR